MKNNIFSRLISLSCAAVMMLSSFCRPVSAVEALYESEAETEIIYSDENELCQQVIELYPNGEETGQIITLDGLMPQGASAEAIDVSDEHEGIVAFDITITDGDSEFQPGEGNPIFVEITDPAIPEAGNIELWHIHDDSTREQIFDFTMTDSGISFYAEGFSIYEIVELTNINETPSDGWTQLKTIDDILYYAANNQPLYIGTNRSGGINVNDNTVKFVSANIVKDKNSRLYGLGKTSATYYAAEGSDLSDISALKDNDTGGFYIVDAEKADIENEAGNSTIAGIKCHIAVQTADGLKYVKHPESADDLAAWNDATVAAKNTAEDGMMLTDSAEDATWFAVFNRAYKESNTSRFEIRTFDKKTFHSSVKDGIGKYIYWNAYGGVGNNVLGFWGAGTSGYGDDIFRFWAYNAVEYDPNELDGKDYGIFYYSEGATKGNALMAEGETHSLIKLILTADGNNRVLYVDENNEIDRWTFSYDSTDGTYTLSNGSGKYLCADQSGVSVTDNAEAAGKFNVRLGGDKRVKLSCDGNFLKFDGSGFTTTTDDSDAATWLDLLDRAEMEETDLITFFRRQSQRFRYSEWTEGHYLYAYLE